MLPTFHGRFLKAFLFKAPEPQGLKHRPPPLPPARTPPPQHEAVPPGSWPREKTSCGFCVLVCAVLPLGLVLGVGWILGDSLILGSGFGVWFWGLVLGSGFGWGVALVGLVGLSWCWLVWHLVWFWLFPDYVSYLVYPTSKRVLQTWVPNLNTLCAGLPDNSLTPPEKSPFKGDTKKNRWRD